MAQTVDAFGYIHPTAVGQCCAAWSWSYGATSLVRLAITIDSWYKCIKKKALNYFKKWKIMEEIKSGPEYDEMKTSKKSKNPI